MGWRGSDQLWSRRQWIGRLRLLVTVLAGGCVIAAVVTSTLGQLPSQLRIGGSLASLLAVVAILLPQLERLLKQALDLLSNREQQLTQELAEQDANAGHLAERPRQDLLEQIRKNWVQLELEGSLKEVAPIELRLIERPAAVDYAPRRRLQRVDEADRTVEAGKSISDIYWDVGKQLLILGEPGAGKTTLLLKLTEQLLNQASAPDEPMPVVFQLSTWAVRRPPLAIWLADELRTLYGVPRPLGQYWVNHDNIVPLLDGLDEVAPEHRDACMAAINDFHGDHGQQPLVICSRVAEYEALQNKLELRGAVVIQPLTRGEVEQYLRQMGRPLAGVRSALRSDEQLWELLTTPLFISTVALAYRGKPADAIRAKGTLEERRRFILADYVEIMLHRAPSAARPARYSPEQTLAWLVWLAQMMRARAQTILYSDWMQPDWLPTPLQQRLVTVGVPATAGLVCGLANVAVTTLFSAVGPNFSLTRYEAGQGGVVLVFGLDLVFFGLIVGLATYESGIVPTDRLRWSWADLRRSLPGLVRAGLFGGMAVGLVTGLTIGLVAGLGIGELVAVLVLGGVVWGVLGVLVTGLVFGPVSALQPRLDLTPTAPGKGMQSSKRNALVGGVVGGLLGALAGSLLGWLSAVAVANAGLFAGEASARKLALVTALNLGLHFALVFGLIAWFRRGGGAYLRHLVLRWLLVRNRATPRNYLAFLDYASGLILLRRRGGGYEFIHRLLLEYFASLESQGASHRSSDNPSTA